MSLATPIFILFALFNYWRRYFSINKLFWKCGTADKRRCEIPLRRMITESNDSPGLRFLRVCGENRIE